MKQVGGSPIDWPNPQVELTVKQRCRCLIPVMLRTPAAAHLQRWAS